MPPSAHLSIAIVCKNNEKTLPAVLAAVRTLVDGSRGVTGEIVAVDSGSTDRTLTLLTEAGARIIHSEWLGHVKTKQLALDLASKGLEVWGGGWVLCLDSDEPPTPTLQDSVIGAVLSNDAGMWGYRMIRKVWYRGRPLEHAWQPEWRLRLVRAGRCRWTGDDPHDRMETIPGGTALQSGVGGNHGGPHVGELAGDLRHDSFETFADHLAKQVALSRIAARSAFAAGSRSSRWKLVTNPIGAFLKQIVLKSAWRDGTAGWLAAGTTAAGALMKHMILLELAHEEASPSSPPRHP